MVGRVTYDETRLSHVTARVSGRLERLFVDYTGVKVNEGDHLVDLYSPALLEAQEELLTTQSTVHQLGPSASDYLRKSTMESFQAARDKLLLWGLNEDQLSSILERGSAEDHITLRTDADNSTVALHRHQLLQHLGYADSGLGADRQRVGGFDADDILDLLLDPARFR